MGANGNHQPVFTIADDALGVALMLQTSSIEDIELGRFPCWGMIRNALDGEVLVWGPSGSEVTAASLVAEALPFASRGLGA